MMTTTRSQQLRPVTFSALVDQEALRRVKKDGVAMAPVSVLVELAFLDSEKSQDRRDFLSAVYAALTSDG